MRHLILILLICMLVPSTALGDENTWRRMGGGQPKKTPETRVAEEIAGAISDAVTVWSSGDHDGSYPIALTVGEEVLRSRFPAIVSGVSRDVTLTNVASMMLWTQKLWTHFGGEPAMLPADVAASIWRYVSRQVDLIADSRPSRYMPAFRIARFSTGAIADAIASAKDNGADLIQMSRDIGERGSRSKWAWIVEKAMGL